MMETLKWVLIAGGVITLVLVYGGYFLGGRRRRNFSDTQDTALESLDDATTLSNATLDPALIERALHQRDAAQQRNAERGRVAPAERTAPALDYVAEPADLEGDRTLAWRRSDEAEEDVSVAVEEPSLTVINVMARPGQVLSGVALANAFEQRGFELGERGLYHFHHDHGCIFSIVNMVEPGPFDPAEIHALTTPGVCFFLDLPGPLRDDVAYDMMVAEAYEISKAIGADLRDGNHAPVTRTHLEETRARLIRSANARFGETGGRLIT